MKYSACFAVLVLAICVVNADAQQQRLFDDGAIKPGDDTKPDPAPKPMPDSDKKNSTRIPFFQKLEEMMNGDERPSKKTGLREGHRQKDRSVGGTAYG